MNNDTTGVKFNYGGKSFIVYNNEGYMIIVEANTGVAVACISREHGILSYMYDKETCERLCIAAEKAYFGKKNMVSRKLVLTYDALGVAVFLEKGTNKLLARYESQDGSRACVVNVDTLECTLCDCDVFFANFAVNETRHYRSIFKCIGSICL